MNIASNRQWSARISQAITLPDNRDLCGEVIVERWTLSIEHWTEAEMRYYSSDCELSLSYWDQARVELWLIGTQVLLGSLAGSATRLDLQAKRDRRAHAHARTSARTPLLLLLPACSILRPPSSVLNKGRGQPWLQLHSDRFSSMCPTRVFICINVRVWNQCNTCFRKQTINKSVMRFYMSFNLRVFDFPRGMVCWQ